MDTIIRALVVYVVVLVIFRLSGKRSLAQTTTFDLVLALIISESIQQALLANDSSITHAFLLVVGLVGLDIIVSVAKQKSPAFARVAEGLPVVLVTRGKLDRNCMNRERVDMDDLLQAARSRGLARLEQIDYAVIEQSGEISIVARQA